MGFFGFIWNVTEYSCYLCIIANFLLEMGILSPKKTKEKGGGFKDTIGNIINVASEVNKAFNGSPNKNNNNNIKKE